MNYNEMFIENNLPAVLTKDELMRYFENYRNGDEKARQIIIYHNIRLVLYEVRKRFCNTMHDEKDLVSIGLIGLIKSVDGFDLSRNIEFMTYATRCIDNEILMFLFVSSSPFISIVAPSIISPVLTSVLEKSTSPIFLEFVTV